MNTQLKRLDRVIAMLAKTRNDIAQNPEIELEIDRLLNVVEVSTSALVDEVDEELK